MIKIARALLDTVLMILAPNERGSYLINKQTQNDADPRAKETRK